MRTAAVHRADLYAGGRGRGGAGTGRRQGKAACVHQLCAVRTCMQKGGRGGWAGRRQGKVSFAHQRCAVWTCMQGGGRGAGPAGGEAACAWL